MKKLMIAAAIVCAAAMSQAANFSWTTSTKMYGPDLANLKVGTMDAEGGQLSSSSIAWVYTLAFENSDGVTDTVTINQEDMAWKSGKVNFAKDELSSKAVYKGEGDDKVEVAYSIVVTGDYEDPSGTKWHFESNAIEDSESFGEMASLAFITDSVSTWTVTSQAVPEPTSGLLLLLGVAGLALRRRRA